MTNVCIIEYRKDKNIGTIIIANELTKDNPKSCKRRHCILSIGSNSIKDKITIKIPDNVGLIKSVTIGISHNNRQLK